MTTWPSVLPCGLREDFNLQHGNPLLRTQLQTGRYRQRRAFTFVPTIAQVSWLMTRVQAQYFESWFEGVLVSGSAWFDLPIKTPLGIKNYTARFTEMYKGPILTGPDYWKFTGSLELRERPILSGDWALYSPDFIIYQNIFDIAMNREWPEA